MSFNSSKKDISIIIVVISFVWTVLCSVAVYREKLEADRNIWSGGYLYSQAMIEKDAAYRLWNFSHGGVYVPITEKNQPNPYISDHPDRDIVTTSGKKFTKVISMPMIRQINELSKDKFGVYSRMISLHPIHPANIPDKWEAEALFKFEKGVNEEAAISDMNGEKYFRLIRARVTEKRCLKCHARHGYMEGDVRGAVSVAVPITPLKNVIYNRYSGTVKFLLLLWLSGFIVLLLLGYTLINSVKKRDRVQCKLLDSETRYRAVVEDQTELVFRFNKVFELTFANKAFCNYFSKDLEDPFDWKIKEIIDFVDYEDFENHVNLLSLFNPVSTQAHYINLTGQNERYLHMTVRAIFDHQDSLVEYQVVASDFTERRKMEDNIVQTQKLESLGVLAGGIAHDFNNLLQSIIGHVSLAKLYSGTEGRVFDKLKKTERAALRASELTQQLLTFSKGGIPVIKTMYLQGLLEEAVSFALRGSAVSCEYSLPDILNQVEVDGGQISQVFHNLVLNSVQAMPSGGKINVDGKNITVDKDNSLSLPPGRYVNIILKDTGKGIPEHYLQKVFDPYFSTKRGGNGLGLAVSYSIIKKHNGVLIFESEYNKGTSVSVYLPASDKPVEEHKKSSKIYNGSGKILVMDDEEEILAVVKEMIAFLGYEVELVKNGFESIKAYKKAFEENEPYDAVILDLTIPGGMGGKEAIQSLLFVDPKVKALASSGYADDPVMADFKAFGFKGVVPKPYNIETLSEVLKEVVYEDNPTCK